MTKCYFLLISFFATAVSFAQEATNNASGNGQAGNIILDWSLGEMTLVSTERNGNLVFTQGLHQGKLILFQQSGTISDGELLITPNPTTGLLNVLIGFLQTGQLHLSIYDGQGRLLMERNETVTGFSTKTINLAAYPNGLYMIQALFSPASGEMRKRTYKILKLQ
jgi:hypothetical protein